MKKVSKALWTTEAGKDKPAITVGLDLGDRYSRYIPQRVGKSRQTTLK